VSSFATKGVQMLVTIMIWCYIFFQNAIICNTHWREQNKLLYLGLIQLSYQRSMLIMAVLVSSYNSLVSGLEEYLQT